MVAVLCETEQREQQTAHGRRDHCQALQPRVKDLQARGPPGAATPEPQKKLRRVCASAAAAA